jgi:TolA-binding protein
LLLAGESWTSAAPAQPLEPTSPPAAPPTDEPPAPSPPATRTPAPRAPAKAAAADARSLFAVATGARVQGRNRQAAAALETLCRKFPEDPRAALAALELGRIRLDTLHEPGPAAVAFRMAMNLAGDSSLREDAATRFIEALDRKGDASACRAARDAYLAEYPTGPHVGSVTGACRGR